MFFGNYFTLILFVLNQSAVLATTTIYIAVITEIENETPVNVSSATAIVLTPESSNSIFERATRREIRQKTHISKVRDDFTVIALLDAPTVTNNVTFKSIFVAPADSQHMYDIIMVMYQRDRTAKLGAVVEVAHCNPDLCQQIEELKSKLDDTTAILSTCCFTTEPPVQQNGKEIGPKQIFESLEPHSIIHLSVELAKLFNWRRFHIVISPNWPTLDGYSGDIDEAISLNAGEDLAHGKLIFTKSFFCTEYLAHGEICSGDQAKDIVLRQATVIFLLLDRERDLPEFIRQLNGIDEADERLRSGKAIFVVDYRGVIQRLYDLFMDTAHEGLMVMRQRRLLFDDFQPARADGFKGLGIDALLYAQLRMVSKALELREQQPEKYYRVTDLYCSTRFDFDDSIDWIGYSPACDRHEVTIEIINVKPNAYQTTNETTSQHANFLNVVYLFIENRLYDVAPSHWYGSEWTPPSEDFCKLDGAGCPPPPLELGPIVGPAVTGFVLIAGSIALTVYRIHRNHVKRKEQDEAMKAMVVLRYESLQFNLHFHRSGSSAKSHDSTGSLKNATRHLRRATHAEIDSKHHDTEMAETVMPLSHLVRVVSQSSNFNSKFDLIQCMAQIQNEGPAPDDDDNRLTAEESNGNIIIPIPTQVKIHDQVRIKKMTRPSLGVAKGPTGGLMSKALYKGEFVFVHRLKRQFVPEVTKPMIQELLKLKNLRHPNINPFYGVTLDTGKICFVQLWCNKGSLASLLTDDTIKLDRNFKFSFIQDIAKGMQFLKNSEIVSHGQLKPDNILVDSRWICKIANIPIPFLAKLDEKEIEKAKRKNKKRIKALQNDELELSESNYSSKRRMSRLSLESSDGSSIHNASMEHSRKNSQETSIGGSFSGSVFGSMMGTAIKVAKNSSKNRDGSRGSGSTFQWQEDRDFFYTAPEILRLPKENRPLRGSPEADVFSFALVCFEILTRERSFGNLNMQPQMLFDLLCQEHHIQESHILRPTPRTPIDSELSDIYEIAVACWEEHPEYRPSFEEVLTAMKELNAGKDSNLIDQIIILLDDKAEVLEETIQARIDELRSERQLKNDLQSITIPAHISADVKAGRSFVPQTFKNACVMVTGVADFAELVKESSPAELVHLLDEFMAKIDKIVLDAKSDVFKFDCNAMALVLANGLTDTFSSTNYSEMACMALDILKCASDFQIPFRGDSLQLRCGIHCGSTLAFLGASNRPSYQIFGDAFDTALGLEQSCPALSCHISKAMRKKLFGSKKFTFAFEKVDEFFGDSGESSWLLTSYEQKQTDQMSEWNMVRKAALRRKNTAEDISNYLVRLITNRRLSDLG